MSQDDVEQQIRLIDRRTAELKRSRKEMEALLSQHMYWTRLATTHNRKRPMAEDEELVASAHTMATKYETYEEYFRKNPPTKKQRIKQEPVADKAEPVVAAKQEPVSVKAEEEEAAAPAAPAAPAEEGAAGAAAECTHHDACYPDSKLWNRDETMDQKFRIMYLQGYKCKTCGEKRLFISAYCVPRQWVGAGVRARAYP